MRELFIHRDEEVLERSFLLEEELLWVEGGLRFIDHGLSVLCALVIAVRQLAVRITRVVGPAISPA